MTRERWEEISRIFELALEIAPAERDALLDTACRGDIELRTEVDRLLANYKDLGSFLEMPLHGALLNARSPVFQEGAIVCGKFRVIALHGSGGMGEVYEARDIELDEVVALKTVRMDWARDAQMLARFRQETQLLRRITHPNVCRIFDYYRDNETSLFSMEFLSGETLAERLTRAGRLPPSDVLRLGSQIARGLDAAHALGIVHRDLKPANVMLVASPSGEERAVIMDFGLARVLDDASRCGAQPATGPQIGTLAYMAPEQFGSATVSASADIFAFGLILYEMLTGVHAPRTDERPPSPRALAPELARSWERSIAGCLEWAPERRFRTASEAIRAAEGARRPHVRMSRRSALAIAGAATVSLFGIVFRFINRERPLPRGAMVLLTRIRNGTRDADLDSVTGVLHAQLEQSAYLQLLNDDQIREGLNRMVRPNGVDLDAPTARELAMREDAAAVIFGAIDQLGQEYVLQIRVERVGAHPSVPGASSKRDFTGAAKRDLFGALADAATWIRTVAGETATEIADRNRAPQEITTASWDALRLFSQSERARQQGRNTEAIPLLEESLRLDPDFALASMSLADVLVQIGRYEDGYSYWRKAAESVSRRAITTREALRIRSLYANDTGDSANAQRLFELYAVQFPGDYRAHFYLAGALEQAGKFEAAVVPYEKAAQLSPSSFAIEVHLAMAGFTLGRLDEARRHIARVRSLGQSGWSLCLEGTLHFLNDEFAQAENSFVALADLTDAAWKSRSYALRACLAAEQNRYDQALALLEDGIGADRRLNLASAEADKNLARGQILIDRDARVEARAAAQNCLALDESPARLVQAGAILARAGFAREAEHALGRLPPLSSGLKVFATLRDRLQGELRLASGDSHGALIHLERAAKSESALLPKDYLARAYLKAGQLPAATEKYRQLAASRGLLLRSPDRFTPGLWSNSVAMYKKLSTHLPPNKEKSHAE